MVRSLLITVTTPELWTSRDSYVPINCGGVLAFALSEGGLVRSALRLELAVVAD